MAQNLQQLKRKIRTSKNIAQIAKALEMIAASKIKKAQTASLNNKPYADRMTHLTARLIDMVDKSTFTHPYIAKKGSTRRLLIAITPDRGLNGSLNTNLHKKLIELNDSKTKIITIGKKAESFVKKLDFDSITSFPSGNTIPEYSTVYKIKSLIDQEVDKDVSDVQILYADFQSLFTQKPTIQTLLPLQLESLEKGNDSADSIFEPNIDSLLFALLPYYLEVQIYNALLQAFTSEQAAQMVAMQNAKNNANDIAEHFTLVYNKSRQEKITNEILDLSNSQQI